MGFEIESAQARWSDMLDKLIVLNRGGDYPMAGRRPP
jgi:hypothetical protein